LLLQINNILRPEECAAALEVLGDDALWRDGKETAGHSARKVKNNLQADAAAPAVKGVIAKVRKALLANDVFAAAAQPHRFVRLMVNRYGPGMTYGPHVDAPYIDDLRTDLSFTVFLNGPDDYRGGALVINHAGAEDVIRGPAGSVVLYPSSAVHRIEPVAEGARTACFGWVKSRIRSDEQRAILFELECVRADLRALDAPQALRDRLNNVRNKLLRQFGD
jgi:PKHD-type hydroxylase